MAKACICDHNGAPALVIDGKAYPPMTFCTRNVRENMNDESVNE